MQYVGNHKCGGRFETRRKANGVGISNQDFVGILVPNIFDIFGIMAVDCADKDASGDAERFIANRRQEFLGRQYLAALHAVNVRNDAFDLVDLMLGYPIGEIYSHKTICAQTSLKRSSQPAHIMGFNLQV